MEIRRPAELGAYIMSIRRAKGMSQNELAGRLGVSRVWIGQVERGKVSPRLDLVLRTLNELQITLSVSTENDARFSQQQPSIPPGLIDIDAIADTNLAVKRGSEPHQPPRRRR
jgi:HTH-type transcriptional regulator/antitoxin HipB